MRVKIKTWEALIASEGVAYQSDDIIPPDSKPAFTKQMEEQLPPDRIIDVDGWRWGEWFMGDWMIEPELSPELQKLLDDTPDLSESDVQELAEATAALTSSPFTDDSAERKNYPVYSGCLNYFPDALAMIWSEKACENTKKELGEAVLSASWTKVAVQAMRLLQSTTGTTPVFREYSSFYDWMMVHKNALAALCKLSNDGNLKHNPGEPLHWSRDKSNDHKDCIARHLIDGDWVELAWRALANLQVELEDASNEGLIEQFEDKVPTTENPVVEGSVVECIHEDCRHVLVKGDTYVVSDVYATGEGLKRQESYKLVGIPAEEYFASSLFRGAKS